jgi:glycosyltransferase involved in cell wall biosynthesis
VALEVLRVYHGGRDPSHRLRERALVAAGARVTLVVPQTWPDGGAQEQLSDEPFRVIELETKRSGDVNRHGYASPKSLRDVVERVAPDLVDLHEEPFSVATRQWLAASEGLPRVAYTAQNVDKRFPPPFAQYERAALSELQGLYPCSRQAASVARGKGFDGLITVLPLGRDEPAYRPGGQSAGDAEVTLGLVGRLVPEKGVLDGVRVLAELRRHRRTRLVVVGRGPEEAAARALAAELGVSDVLELLPWQDGPAMAELYRGMHVVLVPSRATETWTEQFGRVIVEAQAAGAVVAGYATGSIPEVMAGAGVLVPEGDVVGLSSQVSALLDDRVRFEGLRRAGMDNVAAMTWESVAARQIAFYEEALSTPRASGRVTSSSARRRAAREEFGPPATLRGAVDRPFALPVLRKDSPWTRALGAALDGMQR